MRLLIAKLASGSVQSVSVALNSETDFADIATDLDSCVRLLRGGEYDLVLMIASQGRTRARDTIARLRREAGHVPMVVLTEQAANELPSMAGALASKMNTSSFLDGDQTGSLTGPIGAPWSWDGPPQGASEMRVRALRGNDYARRIAIDSSSELLRVDGHPVGLSQAEFRIFARLWGQRGRIVSAEELMEAIYGSAERPASRVLPVFLFKLRKKLSGLGLGDLIETAIGRGFTVRAEAEMEAHA